MRNKALTFSLIGCLTAAWLSAASAQPNLADLLDQEDAAQPRCVAALAAPNAAPSLTPAGLVKEPIPGPDDADQPVTGRRVALAGLLETTSANSQSGLTKNGTFQRKPFMCKGQPWPKALMTHIADPKQQHLSITYCIPSGANPLIGPAEILTADVPSANVQTPGAPPRVRNHRRWAVGMEIPAARRAALS